MRGRSSELGLSKRNTEIANQERRHSAKSHHHVQRPTTTQIEGATIVKDQSTSSNATYEPDNVVYYENSSTWAYFKQLPSLFQAGTITSETMIWIDSSRFGSEWKQLSQFVQLWHLKGPAYHHHQVSASHLPPPPLPSVPPVAEGEP